MRWQSTRSSGMPIPLRCRDWRLWLQVRFSHCIVLHRVSGRRLWICRNRWFYWCFWKRCWVRRFPTGRGGSGSQRSAELYFYPYFRLCCSRLHDAGMLYSVFGWTLCGEQTDSGGRRYWGKPDGCRISAGMFRISDWSKRNLQSAVPIQDPAVCDSVRKCRPGVLETGTVVEYDGRHPQKVNQKKKEMH